MHPDPVINGGHDDIPQLPGLPGPGGRQTMRAACRGQVPVHHALNRRAPGKRHDQVPGRPLTSAGPSNSSPRTARTTTIRALPEPVPAPGVTASRALMMAATAGADPPSGISPQSRSGEVAARTPLPPTTWATLLACGSPPCARTAGPPPPVTRWKPLSAAVTRPGTPACSSTVDSQSLARVTAAARQVRGGTARTGQRPRPAPNRCHTQPPGCGPPRTRQTDSLATGCPRERLAQRSR